LHVTGTMTSETRVATLAFLGLVCLDIGLAQPPVPADKASISGVVSGTDGKILRRATVHLASRISLRPDGAVATEATLPDRGTETDAEGHFTFDDIAPGGYLLDAQRTGYLTNVQMVRITSGQRIPDLVIKMIPQGVIAGRVVDDEGEILPGATINISMYSPPHGCAGCVVSGGSGTGTTDADGAFSIGGLAPGRYLVSVTAPSKMSSAVTPASADARQEIYVTTYYPDATDRADATPVELAAGAQVRALELKLRKVAVFKLSGKVANAVSGDLAVPDKLTLIRQGSRPPGLSARSVGVSAGGEFSFDGVLPGNYFLEAKSNVDAEDRPALVAWQPISVGINDLDRVVVEMKPAMELRGKVTVEGSPLSSWPQITLTPTDGLNYLDSPMVDSDGQFSVTGMEPAAYNVTVGFLSPPLYLKSMRFNGRDVDGGIADPFARSQLGAIDLGASSAASLELVVSRGAASISGVVSDSNGPVGPGIFVFATRETPPFRIAVTDEKGQFTFKGLPPGQYYVVAMDGPGMLPPEIILKLGTPVTVADGVTSTNLKITTRDELKSPQLQ
jgi:protocatechuate 3,4-dioxygenase beta subunit